MSVSNGKIIAPVSIEDVKTILGESSNDLATLCKSENINIWSKYKPISCKGDFKEYPIREDYEETVTSSYSYYTCAVRCGMNIPIDTYRNLYNNYGGEGFAINACENLYIDNVYGRDGYILIIDFSGYFDNILHEPIFDDLEKKIFDERIINLTKQFVVPFGEKSLGLGSETSQILAINYPNHIDHYIKEVLRIRGYARYMDDSYLIHHSKEYLQYCLQEITRMCDEIGIKLNPNKTQIVKLTHQFTFLKTKYNITESGKILRRVSRTAVTRMRRKMKKFKKFYNQGLMTLNDINCSYQSWRGYLKRKNSYSTLCSLDKLFHDLFAHDIYMELIGRLQYA